MAQSKGTHKTVIGLQAGAASGALSAGILYALLEDGRLNIAALSGSSAGSMSSAVTASALSLCGGDDAAAQVRAQVMLRHLWLDVLGNALPRLVQSVLTIPPLSFLKGLFNPIASAGAVMESVQAQAQQLFGQLINFDVLQSRGAVPVFIGTTDMGTGLGKVFSNKELSPEVIYASCAFSKPVILEGRELMDGGYTVNPPIRELIGAAKGDALDLIIIQTLPHPQEDAKDRSAVMRMAQIVMNAPMMQTLEMVEESNKLYDRLGPEAARQAGLKKVHIHVINDPAHLANHSPASMLNFSSSNVTQSWETGLRLGRQWLAEHGQDLGQRSTWRENFKKPEPSRLALPQPAGLNSSP